MACGKCVWQYVHQVWNQINRCTGGCKCPDTVDHSRQLQTVPAARTISQFVETVTNPATNQPVKGIKNDNFQQVLHALVARDVKIGRRVFQNAADRSNPANGALTMLTTKAAVDAAFKASDLMSTYEWDCVMPLAQPGHPQNGELVIGTISPVGAASDDTLSPG